MSHGYEEWPAFKPKGEKVIFLVIEYLCIRKSLREEMQVPYVFAPPQMNRQRAACVVAVDGALGKILRKGAHVVNRSEFTGISENPGRAPEGAKLYEQERQKLPGD